MKITFDGKFSGQGEKKNNKAKELLHFSTGVLWELGELRENAKKCIYSLTGVTKSESYSFVVVAAFAVAHLVLEEYEELANRDGIWVACVCNLGWTKERQMKGRGKGVIQMLFTILVSPLWFLPTDICELKRNFPQRPKLWQRVYIRLEPVKNISHF